MTVQPPSGHDAGRWRRVEEIATRRCGLMSQNGSPTSPLHAAATRHLRREVEGLLAHANTAEKFLTTPLGSIAPVAEPPRDLIGRRIADYAVVAKLGEGGMGEVYRARDERLGRDVAIKVLPAAVAGDVERLKRFEREARLLARINHPSIGAIYGLVEADGIRALVLELVEGETLSAALARGPLKLERALALAAQIADALDHAHRRGITHRDLKPSNMMLTAGGIKLLDFGIGKWSPLGWRCRCHARLDVHRRRRDRRHASLHVARTTRRTRDRCAQRHLRVWRGSLRDDRGREGIRRQEPGRHHCRRPRSAGAEAHRPWRCDRTAPRPIC